MLCMPKNLYLNIQTLRSNSLDRQLFDLHSQIRLPEFEVLNWLYSTEGEVYSSSRAHIPTLIFFPSVRVVLSATFPPSFVMFMD